MSRLIFSSSSFPVIAKQKRRYTIAEKTAGRTEKKFLIAVTLSLEEKRNVVGLGEDLVVATLFLLRGGEKLVYSP